jgi:hypothetical protein
MRRNKHIVIVVIVVCLLATTVGVVRLCRYYLPQEGPTCALFERYKDNPYVKACLLRDFQVNDTLATNALLLEAATDSAWCELLEDFGTPEEMIELYLSNKDFFVGEGRNSILKFFRDKNDIRKFAPLTAPESRVVIASHSKKSLCIFMTENENQKEAICLNEVQKLKKQFENEEKH